MLNKKYKNKIIADPKLFYIYIFDWHFTNDNTLNINITNFTWNAYLVIICTA